MSTSTANLSALSLAEIHDLESRYHRQVKVNVKRNLKGYPAAAVTINPATVRSDVLVRVNAQEIENRIYFFVLPAYHVQSYSAGLKIWFGENRNPNEIEHWKFCKGYR